MNDRVFQRESNAEIATVEAKEILQEPSSKNKVRRIEFVSRENRIDLTSLLPKGWRFRRGNCFQVLIPPTSSEQLSPTHIQEGGEVEYDSEQLQTWKGQLSLLHEIGHSIDYNQDPQHWENMYTLHKISTAADQITPFDRKIAEEQPGLKALLHSDPFAAIELIQESVQRDSQYQDRLFDGLLNTAIMERRAHAIALKLTRALRKQGVDIVKAVTEKEWKAYIHNELLHSYWRGIRSIIELRYGLNYARFQEFCKKKGVEED